MLTPQTDSVNCLALVLCQSIIVKCIFLVLFIACFSTTIPYLRWNKVVYNYDLSIGAIVNDLERPLTQIWRSCRYSTLNNVSRPNGTRPTMDNSTTMCPKKRPWGNLRLVGYKFVHFARKVSLHYLVKFRTIIVILLQKYDKKMF